MYHVLWADWYLPAALPALDKLFFSQLPRRAHVLDLCCGSGHVTKEILKRGYRVTGVDSSAQLIALAKRDLPSADFRVQDATRLKLNRSYDAALSTFDSLNHILTLEDLTKVFEGVYRYLERDGLFVFDMNLEEAYTADSQQWTVDTSDRSVSLVRGRYDPTHKRAFTELIWFVSTGKDNLWQRRHSVVEQRCYEESEILMALREAGFRRFEVVPATQAGVTVDLGLGRMFFVTHRD